MREWPTSLRCDFCGRWTHTDELKRVRRPHQEVWICLTCIEERQLGEKDVLKQKVKR
jgi:ribosomal protein L37AE/L43A